MQLMFSLFTEKGTKTIIMPGGDSIGLVRVRTSEWPQQIGRVLLTTLQLPQLD